MINLTIPQAEVIHSPLKKNIFLEGPAGVGKTTVGVERMLHLLRAGIPGSTIAIITPQRSLADPYLEGLYNSPASKGGQVTFLTIGGLAQRMTNLFWPLIAREAGFGRPQDPPIFLTLETAQYYMAYLVRPLLQEGYFDSVVMDRNRLYSQILDNLNKAAFVGFPCTEIGERLKAAWIGEPAQLRVYDDTQYCATRFRQFCLENNLLDFSLQMHVFTQYLWSQEQCFEYITHTFRHLIVDNIEEDTPAAHDLIGEWLTRCGSGLIIYDHGAGYRRFLGADPDNAYRVKDVCTEHYTLEESLVVTPGINLLRTMIEAELSHNKTPTNLQGLHIPLIHDSHRFFPQMLDWVVDEITTLVRDDGLPPEEIAVLAPFLSDSLRFALTNRLANKGIHARSHRPSRSLRDEPTTQCLYVLSAISHPEWNTPINKFDLAYALTQAIDGLDLIRAHLLTEIVFRKVNGVLHLSSFGKITTEMQERITYQFGTRYEVLRVWLQEYQDGPRIEPEYFLKRLFGELLSQPGYGFHAHYESGEITAKVIESIRKFRRVAEPHLTNNGISVGKEYWQMVQDGVIAAQYLQPWQASGENAVMLLPAHTFLMSNSPVSVQFWLDLGSRAWSERVNQPLTHPYVLSRQWHRDQPWTDIHEMQTEQDILVSLITGLLHRCREKVYLGISEFSEQGYDQRSPLLRAFQHVMRTLVDEDR